MLVLGISPILPMRIVTSVVAMQRQARRWQRTGARVAFVPTMGYLHADSLSVKSPLESVLGGMVPPKSQPS